MKRYCICSSMICTSAISDAICVMVSFFFGLLKWLMAWMSSAISSTAMRSCDAVPHLFSALE